MKRCLLFWHFVILACGMFFVAGGVDAQDNVGSVIDMSTGSNDTQHSTDWRFQVGLTYISGFLDVKDRYVEVHDVDATVIPVGLSFNVALQLTPGDVIAGMPSLGIGPIGFIYIQEDTYKNGTLKNSSSETYLDIPLVAAYGVKFLPRQPIGPYLKAGVAYHIASGDQVGSAAPGLYVGGGLEFLQTKRVGFLFEVAYDASTVTFTRAKSSDREIKTGAALVSIRAVF